MKRLFKGIFKICGFIFTALAIFIICLAIYNFASIKVFKNSYTNFFGYTFFEVISGSMSPYIEKNDFIFVDVGSEFEVDDVVTFEKDGSFITHRVIEINNNVVITRGDANNSVDNPINKDKIIGKVVKIVPNAGVWIGVITTPKVALAILITVILVTLCFSYFNSSEEDEQLNKKEKKGSRMVKTDNNSRLIFELCVLFALLLSLAFLIPFTLSRFKTEARSDAHVDIAFYLVNDEYQYENIKLNDIIPSDTAYTYDFSVSNNDGTNRTETKLKYEVELVATTNLPLTYELYLKDESGILQSVVTSDVVDVDEDNTYFRTINTSSRTFSFESDATDIYQLVVKYPTTYRNYKYQGISENIEIRIISSQVLPGDN